MSWRKSIAVASVALAAACTGATHPAANERAHPAPSPRQELFGFDTYDEPQGDNEATRIVRLDPVTLRPYLFGNLRLGDSITGHVSSPDGRLLALGGANDGEVIVADLLGFDVAWQAKVVTNPAPVGANGVDVFVAAWPRPDRLLAYTEPFAAHATYPARLVVVDPANRRMVRSEPLGGSVIGTAAVGGGRTAFLVAPVGKVGPARLVIAGADGALRTSVLAGTPAGFGPGPSWGNENEQPGIAVAGEHAYVVGNSDRIADVDTTTGQVSYHAVRGLLSQLLPNGPASDPGSGGVMWNDFRTVGSLGHGLLHVEGGDTRPARRGTQNQDFVRSAQIVDMKSWTVRRTLRDAVQIVAANGLAYCWIGDAKFAGNTSTFVALRPDGAVAFRRTNPDATWQVSAGRLFETTYVGDREVDVELDPQTGRVLHPIASLPPYPLDLLPWTAP